MLWPLVDALDGPALELSKARPSPHTRFCSTASPVADRPNLYQILSHRLSLGGGGAGISDSTALGAGAGGQKSGDKSGSQTSGSGGGDLKTSKLNPDDIERIKRQDESGEDWSAVDQQGIGDCFLLATLQAYSNTEKGRQRLRDQVGWSNKDHDFIITLYIHGTPIEVKVDGYHDDYHADGLEGPSSFLSIYERAYGKFLGDEEMKNEMKSKKPLKTGSPRVPGPAGKTSNKLAKVS